MERINKPKVFLSHSKQDIAFIDRLYNDLRKCQIDPWLDSEEIRHGKPWLDAIFEDGIPTCDCVLLYFTVNSIESKMVKKEMDASLIRQLKDKGVAFLPYVIDASVRDKLRTDIQSLQVLVWNDENYAELLPRVVSEIWRSYLERTISTAVQGERIKRLEAELELQKTKNTSNSIFGPAEEADFTYIWKQLDVAISVKVKMITKTKESNEIKDEIIQYTVDLRTLFKCMLGSNNSEYYPSLCDKYIMDHLRETLNDNDAEITYDTVDGTDILKMLKTYGLVESISKPPTPSNSDTHRALSYFTGTRYNEIYTSKAHRFIYWLEYSHFLQNTGPLLTISCQ